MTHSGKHSPELIAAVDEAIAKANKRAADQFDGLFGSLPADVSHVLSDIVEYLRHYLLEERGLSETKIRALQIDALPRAGFHSTPQELEDEGVKVALGILNSVASVLKIKDGVIKLDGRKLNRDETVSLLLSGRSGLQGHKFLKKQRASAQKGTQERIDARTKREAKWKSVGTPLRAKHPNWSNAILAKHIAKQTDESVSTIRQSIPKIGLGRKADK